MVCDMVLRVRSKKAGGIQYLLSTLGLDKLAA
jgi:hypothetical protein